MCSEPLISIGIPVYNGELTISRALKSILNQTYRNIEIIISDNFSDDKTEIICKEFIKSDHRIKYFKQTTNQGAARNFQFVLEKSSADYFMWAAADDEWGEEFLRLTINELLTDIQLIGVTIAPYRFPTSESVRYGYFGIENETPAERVRALIKSLPDGHARFFCLYRSNILKQIDFSILNYLAWDWIASVNILQFGKLRVIYNFDEGFIKHGDGESTRRGFLLKHCNTLLDILRPLRHLTKAVAPDYRKGLYFDLIRLEVGYFLRMLKALFESISGILKFK